jgi:hypothetical protein
MVVNNNTAFTLPQHIQDRLEKAAKIAEEQNHDVSAIKRLNREDNLELFALRDLSEPVAGVPQSNMRTAALSIQLMSAMKAVAIETQANDMGLENRLNLLVNAYENVFNEVTANPAGNNSQSQSKFLEDAFRSVVLSEFERNAKNENKPPFVGESDEGEQSKPLDETQKERFQSALEEARKQANLFADTFLKHFKGHGAGAFSFAWVALFDIKA